MQHQILVTKANGHIEPFDETKLLRSMRRAKIPQKYHAEVLSNIQESLYDGIPTREVYDQINQFFQHHYPAGACTYNLKQAIMELGPSGYPFEKFIASILQHQGYRTTVGELVQGKCVMHEVDVVAEKNQERLMVECKFHNQPGLHSDVKVALYVKSRFDDVFFSWEHTDKQEHIALRYHAMLATNTKCTSEAIQYARCSGITVLSWGFPEHNNLQDLLEQTHLYPITS